MAPVAHGGRCEQCGRLRTVSRAHAPMVLVRCVRCGRAGRVAPRVLQVTPREHICCPRCRALPGSYRMIPPLAAGRSRPFPNRAPLGTVSVACARCRRHGYVPAPRAAILGAAGILCPSCRGVRAPARWVPPAAALPDDVPLARPRSTAGRPPEILARSAARPVLAATASGAPALRSSTVGAVALFEVRCFRCGRYGRLPVRPGVSLRPEEIICPRCRPRSKSPSLGRIPAPSEPPVPVPGLPSPA
ncbi:MAG TPA: hypothetical protein VGU43_01695 [Thermoplasmata archaeon]|nr:hypothetical protein [Thermoplasmata archaeon]